MPCPAGTWSNSTTASQCTQCVAGKYNILVGQTNNTCLNCADGYWSAAGLGVTCANQPCGTGYYCTGGSRVACVAGKFSTATTASSSSTCIYCDAGKYSTGSSSSCLNCAEGKYSTSVGLGSSQCTNCAAGHWSAAGQGLPCDQQCDIGYYCIGGTKTACPTGSTTASTGSTSVNQCLYLCSSSDGTGCCQSRVLIATTVTSIGI